MLVIDSADRLYRRWVLLLVAASPRMDGCSSSSALHCAACPGGRNWACCTARLVGWPLPSEQSWQLPCSCSEESQKVLGAMLEYARDWAQVGGSAQQWARQIFRVLPLSTLRRLTCQSAASWHFGCGLLSATNEPTPPAGGLHHHCVCCARLEHSGAADGWATCAGQQAGWAELVGCGVWAHLCMWAADPPRTAGHGRGCRLRCVTWHPQDYTSCGSAHACCVPWYALLPFPPYTHYIPHAGDHPAQSRAAPPLTVPDISEARCAGLSAVCCS